MTNATLLAKTARARNTASVEWAAGARAIGRALLTLLALVPYVLGWSVGAAVTATAWVWAAAVAGWRDGLRGGARRE